MQPSGDLLCIEQEHVDLALRSRICLVLQDSGERKKPREVARSAREAGVFELGESGAKVSFGLDPLTEAPKCDSEGELLLGLNERSAPVSYTHLRAHET